MKSKVISKIVFYALICFQTSAELYAIDKGLFGHAIPHFNMPSFRAPSQEIGDDVNKTTRAPRPDALSFPGSTPQIVGSSDSALLAEIQKCVCEISNQIRNLSSSATDMCCSEISVVDSKIDVITSITENVDNCCSEIAIIDSKIDIIELQIQTISGSSIDELVATFTLLLVLSNELLSTVEIIVSLSEVISINFASLAEIIQTVIDTVVDIDSKVDVITSILENTPNCCSQIDALTSMVDNIVFSATDNCCSEIAVIDSKVNVITSIVENVTTEDCCSEVNVIDSKINVISSIVAHITFSVPDNCCSQINVIESLVEHAPNCCSTISVIDSKINVITSVVENPFNCCSKVDVLLFNVGSRSDFAFSHTDTISTIAQIDQLNISVIAWLKTLLADLHGL